MMPAVAGTLQQHVNGVQTALDASHKYRNLARDHGGELRRLLEAERDERLLIAAQLLVRAAEVAQAEVERLT